MTDLTVQLFYDGAWHDAPPYARNPVTAVRGQDDEQGEPSPATMSATLDNRSGDYHPGNPHSTLYGAVGRETPARAYLGTPTIEDFEDASLNVTVAHTGAANWARTNTEAHAGTWSYKSGTITHSQESAVWVDVPAGATSVSFWYKVSSEEGFDFFQVFLDGVDLVLSESGDIDWTWTALDLDGASTVVFLYRKDSSVSELDDAAYIDDLEFTDTRGYGEVVSWRPDRSIDFDPAAGRGDAWTDITVADLLRDLDQSSTVLPSAPRTYLSALHPDAYWPMEDVETATAGEAVVGQPLRTWTGTHPSGAVVSEVEWGQGTLAWWLPPVVSRSGSAGLTVLWSTVNMSAVAAQWTVDLMWASGTDGADATIDINPSYLGGSSGWPQVLFLPSVRGLDVGMNAEPEVSATVDQLYDGRPHHVRWTAVQSGSTVTWTVYVDGEEANSGTTSGAMVLPPVETIALTAGAEGGIAQGHLSVWTNPPALSVAVNAAFGWRGETAGARVARLCDESGVPALVVGDPDDTRAMGSQRVATLLDLLDEIRRTDGGLLYTARSGPRLVFRALHTMYNQAAGLTLDWDAGEVTRPLSPVVDDLGATDDVTAQRPDGSSARSTGPAGGTPVTVEVNPDSDADLASLARWYRHLGTVTETRYPRVTPNVPGAPSLAGAVSTLAIGDRLAVTSLPADLAADDLSLIATGLTETLGPVLREVTLVCVAESAYQVAVYDTSRYEGRATLATAVDGDDTSWSVTDAAGLWTTDAGQFPFDVAVSGERVTVTAISGASLPQTWTVTRSVNGVTRSHAAGTAIRLWRQARYAL